MTPEEMQDRLRENGIDSELVTYPNPKAVGVQWQVNGIVWKYDWYGQTPQALSTYMHYLPEQAIAATVGAGTCHMEVHDNLAETEGMGDVWLECDKCHWQTPLEPSTPRFQYCPNCRRIIEEEAE